MSESSNFHQERDKKRVARQNTSEEWDSVFADEDPTRVLSQQTAEEDRTETLSHATNQDRTEALDRTKFIGRTETKNQTSTFNNFGGDEEEPTEAISATSTRSNPYAQHPSSPSPRTAPTPYPDHHYETPTSQPLSPDSSAESEARTRNSRIHFFPALLGWLATYSLLVFSDYFHRLINQIFGLENFEAFPQAFAEGIGLLTPAEGVATPWTWLIIATVLILLSSGFGGYAAARMSRFAPAKQGFGVWLWHLVMVLLATVLAFFTGAASGAETPNLSLQEQINGAGSNIFGVLVVLVLILIGALLGSFFGPRYHKRLMRFSPQNS